MTRPGAPRAAAAAAAKVPRAEARNDAEADLHQEARRRGPVEGLRRRRHRQQHHHPPPPLQRQKQRRRQQRQQPQQRPHRQSQPGVKQPGIRMDDPLRRGRKWRPVGGRCGKNDGQGGKLRRWRGGSASAGGGKRLLIRVGSGTPACGPVPPLPHLPSGVFLGVKKSRNGSLARRFAPVLPAGGLIRSAVGRWGPRQQASVS